jgi:hypothetical protein
MLTCRRIKLKDIPLRRWPYQQDSFLASSCSVLMSFQKPCCLDSWLREAVMTARMRLGVSSTACGKEATTLTNSLGIAQNSKRFRSLDNFRTSMQYPTAASLIHKHWCPCRDQARTEFMDKKVASSSFYGCKCTVVEK